MGECGDGDLLPCEIRGEGTTGMVGRRGLFRGDEGCCQAVYRGGERDGDKGVRNAV